MTTRNGISGFGTPLGTNKLKNSTLLLKKLIRVIPKNKEKAIWKVNIIWPVIVKPYGRRPIKFANRINEKIKRTRGKYFNAIMLFICCLNNCSTNK